MNAVRDPGSFRDPSGYVFESGGRVLRRLGDAAYEHYLGLKQSGTYSALVEGGWLLPAEQVHDDPALGDGSRAVLEHPALTFVSYPYEWPFTLLKRAALHHLDLHMLALDHDFTLTDATAYNIQFRGVRPVFIDILSLRRYGPGEFWLGQRQFSEQFLNPLLLTALLGVAFGPWYRGSLEGISTEDLRHLLRWRHRLSWKLLTWVYLPAWLQRTAQTRRHDRLPSADGKRLPRPALRHLLGQLRRWISGLEPRDAGASVWQNYPEENSYATQEEQAKRAFVADFVRHRRPRVVWDLGCNTGGYAQLALEEGATAVIGFDADHAALERAIARADRHDLSFLPLHLDAANPSPDQGWNQRERRGLSSRANGDAVLALALEHHLAIGRNIPLPDLVDWMIGLAPHGVLEFVPKSDPMIQRMLRLREDIFAEYGQESFERAIGRNARIVKAEPVSRTGRTLYWYDRS